MATPRRWERRKYYAADRAKLDERLKKLHAHGWQKEDQGIHHDGRFYLTVVRVKRDKHRKRPTH